jgi:uncharacterized protein (TIRG00374 family)
VCVVWTLREVRPSELWAALRASRGLGFALLMLLTLVGFWFRAMRWRWLIRSPKPVGFVSLFSATMVGYMANNLLPFRLGEFVRPYVLARRERLRNSALLATIVVERLVDLITLLLIFGIALAVHPISSDSLAGRITNRGAGVLLVMCLALTGLLIVVERTPRLMAALIRLVTSRLPAATGERVAHSLHHFVEGLTLFRDLPRLAWVFVLSFVAMGFFTLCLTASMWAMHLDVPWYGGLVMLVVTAIGIMVPAAPGYIGTLNLACVAGLALFGVGRQAAIPFSWFYWAGQWLPITLVGMWYLRREGLSLGTLTHVEEDATAS